MNRNLKRKAAVEIAKALEAAVRDDKAKAAEMRQAHDDDAVKVIWAGVPSYEA